MKAAQNQISPPEVPTAPCDQGENLIKRLSDERAVRYYGRGWALRVETLAAIQGGTRRLSEIALEYHCSKQAVSRIAKRARAIYGETTPG